MSKISIIVPVYNTGKYLNRCIESLLNQTVQDIEIIVINDGSTDNSDEIIKSYLENNNGKIKYYNKENEGVAKTRNLGIEKAQSDYILFVDSDDYIDVNLVRKVMPYINNKIDIIKFKVQSVDTNGNIIKQIDGPSFDEMPSEKAFGLLYGSDILIDSPCVYVFKRSLFVDNGFKFKGLYHEDFGLIPLVLLSARNMVSLPDYLYNYVQADGSITRNDDYDKTIKKAKDTLYHYDNAIKSIDEMNISSRSKENAKIFYTNAIILKASELKKEEQEEYIRQLKNRKVYKNIKVRNIKQLVKKLILMISIKVYLKIR